MIEDKTKLYLNNEQLKNDLEKTEKLNTDFKTSIRYFETLIEAIEVIFTFIILNLLNQNNKSLFFRIICYQVVVDSILSKNKLKS